MTYLTFSTCYSQSWAFHPCAAIISQVYKRLRLLNALLFKIELLLKERRGTKMKKQQLNLVIYTKKKNNLERTLDSLGGPGYEVREVPDFSVGSSFSFQD